jgi:hypothetical protein
MLEYVIAYYGKPDFQNNEQRAAYQDRWLASVMPWSNPRFLWENPRW